MTPDEQIIAGRVNDLLRRVADLERSAGRNAAWTRVAGGIGFQNSWTDYDTTGSWHPAAYRKVGDRGEVRGLIKNGAANSVAFTLPVGYRPTQTLIFVGHGIWSSSAYVALRFDVGADGTVYIDPPAVMTGLGTSLYMSINCSYSLL
jgi:hypothetical protein